MTSRRAAVLIAILLVTVVGSRANAAESTSDEIRLAGTTEGNGQHFEISDSEYLNVTLDSSQPIHLRIESVPEMITMFVDPNGNTFSTTTISIKGLVPDTAYYKYQDGYRTLEVFTTDAEGNYVFDQNITRAHVMFIQPRKSTKFIGGTATGGDCPNIGIWDLETKTCVLTKDVSETMQVENGVTLDGNGHSVTGTMTGNGIYAGNNAVLKNLTIKNFVNGVFLSYTSYHTLINNSIVNNSSAGIEASNSWNNTISNNYISSNRVGVSLGGFGNVLNDNTVTLNSNSGIQVGNATDNVISNNVVTDNKLDGIVISSSRNHIIENNVANANRNGISLLFSYDNVLRDNVTQENTDLDFSVSAPDFDRQCDNTVENMTGSGGREIKYFNHSVRIENETLSGLILCNADNSVVRNVIIEGSAILKNNEFRVARTDGSMIENVNSSGNRNGIFLAVSNGNTLINNNVSLNNNGFLINFSNDNVITQNTITSNSGGIVFGQSSLNNTLSANNIVSNGTAISLLFGSNNNKIYNNNFVSNQQQALLSGSSGNIFNLPKPMGGNYWSSFDTPSEGCRDLNFDGFCDSTLFLSSAGKDEFPWVVRDGWSQPEIPSAFWTQIKNVPQGQLNLRATAGTVNKPIDDIVKTLPNGWALHVVNTKDSSGSAVNMDGFRWYRVEDATDGSKGWMASMSTTDGTEFLAHNPASQTDLENKAAVLLLTEAARIPVILEAVTAYHTTISAENSLYGGGGGAGDANNFQRFIQNSGFPRELILAIAAQESTSVDFDNENVSFDYGHGVMQITFAASSTNKFRNTWDNRGVGSNVTIPLCRSILSDDYKKCHANSNTPNRLPKPYKNFDNILTNPVYKLHENTSQAIYANIKDGFRTLQEKYRQKCPQTSTTIEGEVFSCQDIEKTLTVWGYNGFAKDENGNFTGHYLKGVADKLFNLNTHFPGVMYVNTDRLIEKLKIADRHKLQIKLFSPGELQISDMSGNVTGNVGGVLYEDIPNSVYEQNDKSAIVLFPQTRNSLRYRVTGTGIGEYGLTVLSSEEATEQAFTATDLPMTPGEVHEYVIDWDALDRGERGVTAYIDTDGNGIADRTVYSDSILTEIEPPIISITSPAGTYILNSQTPIQFTATDAISGIATVTAKLNSTSVNNGQTVTLTKSGANALEVTAMDNEGNTAQATSTFQVLYTTSGFLPSIKADGTGTYNQGSTLPVKFTLTDAYGNSVPNVVVKLYMAKITNGVIGPDEIPVSSTPANTGNQFRYDTAERLYIFNLSTSAISIGKWRLKAVLDNWQNINAIISIR